MESFVNTRRKQIFNECLSSLQTSVELIERYSSPEEKHANMKLIKTIAKDYYEVEVNFDKSTHALNKTSEYFNGEENDCTDDVNETYEKYLEDAVDEHIPFKEHTIWMGITKSITDVQMEKQQNDTNRNSSLLCSQSSQLPIDPLSKRTIQNPYKNKVCGHVYDYESITHYLKSRKMKITRCPYVGCSNSNVMETDLVKDMELTQLISQTSIEGD